MGNQNTRVKLLGYNTGANTINAIKTLRIHTGLGLKEGKETIERCMAGKMPCINVGDETVANTLIDELAKHNFVAKRIE